MIPDLYYFFNEKTGVVIMSVNPDPPTNFGIHIENGAVKKLSWIPLRKKEKKLEKQLNVLFGNNYNADN